MIWKEIGEYAVSNTGVVKSLKWGKERILKPLKDKKGYLYVIFSNNNKIKRYSIHRLVAEAFIPNPNNLPTVNHKNGIKADNSFENLEWSTFEDNMKHAFENGLHTTPKRPVVAMLPNESKEWYFESVHEAGRKTGIKNGNIVRSLKGRQLRAGGYVWRYAQQ